MAPPEFSRKHRVLAYLLENEQGSPSQFWSFEGESIIRIGRSLENDLVILNPYVSRDHAYLRLDPEGNWSVTAISKQGLLRRSEPCATIDLGTDCTFRLGPAGPFLRVSTSSEVCEDTETLSVSDNSDAILQLDLEQLQREVILITSGDYFKRLKSSIDKLRAPATLD